jgi:hypothetical protein
MYIERLWRASPVADGRHPGEVKIPFRVALVRDGRARELVSNGLGHYREDVATSYLDLTVDSSQWQATDAEGNKFQFGLALDKAGAPCQSVELCSRWYLTKVVDVDGNNADYSYLQEADSAGALLTNLSYNSYQATAGRLFAAVVSLTYERDPQAQTEVASGSLITHRQRLTNVQVAVKSATSDNLTTIASYMLSYKQSLETNRSLLSAIEVRGIGNAKGPEATRFTYSNRPDARSDSFGFSDGVPINGRYNDPHDSVMWIDVDGDSRPDLVQAFAWARNVTPPGASTLAFTDPVFGGCLELSKPGSYTNCIDMNGDGLPDRVVTTGERCRDGLPSSDTAMRVDFATGVGQNITYAAPQGIDITQPALD